MNLFIKYLSIAFVFALFHRSYAQDQDFHIYLCFGQSNMEGQGEIQPKDTIVDSRFQVFQALDCPQVGRKKNQWRTAVPPLCQCNSGLSPADYFGKTMVANLPENVKVGVVSVAVGGCDIRLFDKDSYEAYLSTHNKTWFTNKIKYYKGNPYLYLMDLAKEAQKNGVIKGILLHQGETNTGDKLWPTYVKKIYNDMLTDLSLDASEVPLLSGEVVSVGQNCCSSMNEIINTLPDFIPTAHIVSSKDCMAKDNAHFDSEGYRVLGKRYAETMLSLLNKE